MPYCVYLRRIKVKVFMYCLGDAHFDDEEFWTIGETRGTQLLQTAAHEFGHSLGLSHSDNKVSLMTPFHRGYIRNLKLGMVSNQFTYYKFQFVF